MTVIGRGVVGTTTAITLSLLGIGVRLCGRPTAKRLTAGERRPPEIASLHAAASVIPHSVAGNDVDSLLRVSLLCFEHLVAEKRIGAFRRQRHYEMFEEVVAIPSYSSTLREFRRVSQGDVRAPRRNTGVPVQGWSFDVVFCDMPRYLVLLENMADRLGIERVAVEVGPHDLARLDADVLVNCAGLGSVGLFGLGDKYLLRKGVWALWKSSTPLQSRPVSYNYTPVRSVYSTPQGVPADVYCYPRADGLLLGGTRLEGRLDSADTWQGERYVGEVVDIDGIEVPKPVLALNEEILRNMNPDLPRVQRSALVAGVGYRFTGPNSMLVLGNCTWLGRNTYVIHNYGHGGSGVTLSWGSAYEVARIVCGLNIDRNQKSDLSFGTRTPVESVLTSIQKTL